MLLLSHWEDRDTAAFCFYDLRERQFVGNPFTDSVYDVGAYGYDVGDGVGAYGSQLIRDQTSHIVVGLIHQKAKPNSIYFNESYRKLHQIINQALPGTFSRILGSYKENYLVLEVESDVAPPICYLLDRKVWKWALCCTLASGSLRKETRPCARFLSPLAMVQRFMATLLSQRERETVPSLWL